MEKNVLVPVADGTEELEAMGIVDVLRRAGANVTMASVTGNLQFTTSHEVRIMADRLIGDCINEDYDLVVLPGGIPGADNLRDSKDLVRILKNQNEKQKLYGAICASPAVILEHHGLLKGKKATCHPGFVDQLANPESVESIVVTDGNCVTSRGAGTAVAFALELVRLLYGPEKRAEVAGAMVTQ